MVGQVPAFQSGLEQQVSVYDQLRCARAHVSAQHGVRLHLRNVQDVPLLHAVIVLENFQRSLEYSVVWLCGPNVLRGVRCKCSISCCLIMLSTFCARTVSAKEFA
jgi:hypothetical protein